MMTLLRAIACAALVCAACDSPSEFEDLKVDRIVLDPNIVVMAIGDTLQLHVAVFLTDGSTASGVPLEWVSSNPAAATLDPDNAEVHGVAEGRATVTARFAGVSGQSDITVTATPTSPRPAQVELPREEVSLNSGNPTGDTVRVSAGGDLQAALNAAKRGDIILLARGSTYQGNYVLPAKSGTGWIYIRTDGTLPPGGTRMTPDQAAGLARIQSPNSAAALSTAAGASHYHVSGVEVTVSSSITLNYGIITLGSGSNDQASLEGVPNHIILDRVYVHGHPALHVSRCVAFNSAHTAVIDSYLSECHGSGFDTQAIAGWNGPGPFRIENNYLGGAGENVMFGGADSKIVGLVPSDIVIRRNHFHKPMSWQGLWSVKNLLELKNAQRVLIEGNVFENNWVDGQVGFAWLFWSVNQGGSAPWSVTQDVTVRYNILRKSAAGANLAGRWSGGHVDQPMRRVHIHDNLLEEIGLEELGGVGRLFQFLGPLSDITIEHNTAFVTKAVTMFDGSPTQVLQFENNIITRGSLGVVGTGSGEGSLTLNQYAPGHSFTGNAIIGAEASRYPPDNQFPANVDEVGFVNSGSGDFRLADTSPLRRDGAPDPGADISRILQLTAGVKSN